MLRVHLRRAGFVMSAQGFAELFAGRTDAYGTGQGRWVREPVTLDLYECHLRGEGPGLGIAPLFDDGTVRFAAIDLDEPNFQAARDMQEFLGFGTTFIERSRSGNAHVWAFFADPIEAWVVRGLMKETITAVGLSPHVEVFPKQDRLLENMVGNYINLPYHGDDRPVLMWNGGRHANPLRWHQMEMSLESFVEDARANLNDPDVWRKRARWLMIEPPEARLKDRAEYGTGKELHLCAEWIIANRESNPVTEGHRNVVYFNLAKMLGHYEGIADEEAYELLQMVSESSPDPMNETELRRIVANASRGRYTSTGCDDPLMSPYVHPDCPIARGG